MKKSQAVTTGPRAAAVKRPGWGDSVGRAGRMSGSLPAIMVMALSMVIAVLAAVSTQHGITSERRATFDSYAADSRVALEARVEDYGRVLDAAAGLVLASTYVTARDWDRFVDALQLGEALPGLNGLGLIEPVPHDRIPAYEARGRGDGITDFRVHPMRLAGEHFVVKYISPLDRNRNALGLDIGFEQHRRTAAELARDTGQTVLSGPISLMQDTTNPGFLLLRPLYRPGAMLATVEDRRAAFRGWVYGPLSGRMAMAAMTAQQGVYADLEVYDGPEITEEALIYSSQEIGGSGYRPSFSQEARIDVYGRTWTVRWTSTPDFDATQDNRSALLVLIIGAMFAIFFGRLFQLSTRREAYVRREVELKTLELTEKTEEARSVFDNATVPILLLDADFRVLTANRAVRSVFGYANHEIVGRSIQTIIPELHPGDDAPTRQIGGCHRDGRTLRIEVNLTGWLTGHGASRFTLVVRDVTEEHTIGSRLREAENRWDMALKGAQIGVFDVDLKTGRSVVSETWRNLMRLPPGKDIGGTQDYFLSRIHPEDRMALEDADAACVMGVTERSVSEYRVEVEPGNWRWMRSDAVVVERDGSGRALRLVGAQTDITNIRRAEDALRTSREQFRMVLENAPVGMAVIDGMGSFVNANPALCEILGCSQAEIWDMNFATILLPDEYFRVRQSINWLSLDRKKTYVGEHMFRRADDSVVWCLLSIAWTLNENNEIDLYIAQVQDITERKALERAKSEFVATVSHELRTPLTSIKGALGLVFGTMSKDISAPMKRLLDIASSNTNRLADLVNDILDMEKISSGKMTFDYQEIPVSELVPMTIEEMKPYAAQYNVGIRLEAPDTTPLSKVDPIRFAQIMSNLMSNAIKFSHTGNQVVVTVENRAASVRISVQDFGVGIPESFRSRIFQPFSQADSSDTRRKGGTGLGLNITKQLVEMMGGSMDFVSKENFGTTFWFELPTLDETVEAEAMEAAE